MTLKHLTIPCLAIALMCIPASAFATKLEDAAKQAARQNNAKVLSARTIQQGNNRTHEIKLLTNKGVVKTVRVPDQGQKKKK